MSYEYEIVADYGYGEGTEVLTVEATRAEAVAVRNLYRREEGLADYRIRRRKLEPSCTTGS